MTEAARPKTPYEKLEDLNGEIIDGQLHTELRAEVRRRRGCGSTGR